MTLVTQKENGSLSEDVQADAKSGHGVPVRAASRAFEVLESINRLGSPTIMEITEECAIPYATAFRMVMTLLHDGWIESEPARKRYRPTQKVWSLVSGFQTQDLIVAHARDHLIALTSEVLWPATLSNRVGNRMMVKDSTHNLTSQTFANYYPGYTLPIFDCAAGKSYLAFCTEKERRTIFDNAKRSGDEATLFSLQIVDNEAYLDSIRQQGFASHVRVQHTENPGKTSALAVPIRVNGEMNASVAMVYFASAMTEQEAIEQYVPSLIKTAENIGRAASNANHAGA